MKEKKKGQVKCCHLNDTLKKATKHTRLNNG